MWRLSTARLVSPFCEHQHHGTKLLTACCCLRESWLLCRSARPAPCLYCSRSVSCRVGYYARLAPPVHQTCDIQQLGRTCMQTAKQGRILAQSSCARSRLRTARHMPATSSPICSEQGVCAAEERAERERALQQAREREAHLGAQLKDIRYSGLCCLQSARMCM